jgi:hypothetical protein
VIEKLLDRGPLHHLDTGAAGRLKQHVIQDAAGD